MARYGVQIFDEKGHLQATLTENEVSIVHYTLFYPKGSGKQRDMKFLSERVKNYPGYKVSGGVNIAGSSTWTWDGGTNGFEVVAQQPVSMGNEWYAISAIAEESSTPLIRPWTMPGSTCLYDSGTQKFICRAENKYLAGLYITVGGN